MKPRLDSLTGLRFFAALLVFGRHMIIAFQIGNPLKSLLHVLPQGAVGVSFFFILSGFVLTWSRRAGDQASRFFQRRVARIVPNHVVTWIITAAIIIGTGNWVGPKRGAATLLLVQAWVPASKVYFAMNAASWSLSCELFFYALFPFIIGPVSRLALSRRRLLMLGIVVAIFAIALATRPSLDSTTKLWFEYIFPPVRLLEFGLGVLLALEVIEGTWPRINLGAAVLWTAAAFLLAGYVPRSFMWVATTVIPFTVLIGAAAHSDIAGRTTILRSKTMIRLGEWSFAFYLMHPIVIKLFFIWGGLQNHVFNTTEAVLGSAVLLVLSVTAAGALYTLVERPAERRLRPAAIAPV